MWGDVQYEVQGFLVGLGFSGGPSGAYDLETRPGLDRLQVFMFGP